MTDGGDGDFEVHPGDPWSPGWTDDTVEKADGSKPSAAAPAKKRRRFGRKGRDEAPAADEWPTEEHVAFSEPTVQPEARFTSAPALEPDAREAAPPAAPGEPPMPAWLSDLPRPEPAPLPVELPAWVGIATAGAEVVAAGFEDAPVPGSAPTTVERPAADELTETLAALGSGDTPEVDVAGEPMAEESVDPALVSRDTFEALRRLEGDEPATLDDPFASLHRLEAEAGAEAGAESPPTSAEEPVITGRYGVAGREAFAVLGDADGDDLSDWRAFAGASTESPEPRRETLEPRNPPTSSVAPSRPPAEAAASDESASTEPEPRKKRGIWPFRRHRDAVEEEAVAEEAAEWIDDGTQPAPGWFADIDEDEVLPPTADLPETEWPASPEPVVAADAVPTVEAPVPVVPAAPVEGFPVPPAAASPEESAPDETGEQAPLDFEAGSAPLVVMPPSRVPEPEIAPPPLRGVAPIEEPLLPAGVAPLDPLDAAEWDDSTVDLPAGPFPYEDEGDAALPNLGQLADYETTPRPVPSLEPEALEEELEDLPSLEPETLEPEALEDLPTLEPEALEEDLEDLRAGGPWRLDFDDGTSEAPYGESAYDPAPAPAVRGDRDVWEPEPAWDPEATEEMTDPGLTDSEDLYGGAGTIEHRGLAEEIYRLGEEDTEWQAMSAAMPGIETGVVGFEDVADLSTGEQYQEGPRSDLGARVGTGLLLLVFLVGTMFVGGAAMAVFIGAMALLGIWEFYGTLRRLGFQPLSAVGYVGGLGLLAAAWFHGPVAIPVALSLLVVVTFFVYAFSPLRQDALANGGLTVLAVAWVAGTAAFATPILRQEDFRILVMAVVAATVAMDVGAFAFGRTWGRRALAPLVSPNKSVEGLLGGILLTMGAGVAIGLFAEPFDLASGIALGVVVSVLAPLGDLAESMVKRSLGVKDMGTILPGHGGVLDRIDGFLFVLPAAWLLYQVTGLLG